MRALVDSYGDRVLIGEIYLPIERLMAYYGVDLGGAHLPFNFQLIGAPWHAASLAELIHTYETALPPGAWGNWVLGNHDQPRIASRIGTAQARVAAMLNRYPDRFLFGTDTVAPAGPAPYFKVFETWMPVWRLLTPEASLKVRRGNYERIFDAARQRVRAWEMGQVK